MVCFAVQYPMITLWKYMTSWTMTWWSWFAYHLFRVLLNGFPNRVMLKLSLPLVILTLHLCMCMMPELVQMNPSSQKRYLNFLIFSRLVCSLVIISLTMINILPNYFLHPLFLFLIYPDPLGPNKSYEVQSCFWLCDICRWQGNHWLLEPYHTSVPREWVCSQAYVCIYFIHKHFYAFIEYFSTKATSLQKNRRKGKKKREWKERKEKRKGKI